MRGKLNIRTNPIVRDLSFFVANMGNYSVRIRLQKLGMTLREDIPVDGGSTTNSTTTGLGLNVPIDTWTTLEMILPLGADTSSATVIVNGTTTRSNVPMSVHLCLKPVEIELGIVTFDYSARLKKRSWTIF